VPVIGVPYRNPVSEYLYGISYQPLNSSAVKLIGQVVIGLVSRFLQTNKTARYRHKRRGHCVT
jgi:hypothetical protein